jgi:hypothetical protein
MTSTPGFVHNAPFTLGSRRCVCASKYYSALSGARTRARGVWLRAMLFACSRSALVAQLAQHYRASHGGGLYFRHVAPALGACVPQTPRIAQTPSCRVQAQLVCLGSVWILLGRGKNIGCRHYWEVIEYPRAYQCTCALPVTWIFAGLCRLKDDRHCVAYS